jgi:hypothetical protein
MTFCAWFSLVVIVLSFIENIKKLVKHENPDGNSDIIVGLFLYLPALLFFVQYLFGGK